MTVQNYLLQSKNIYYKNIYYYSTNIITVTVQKYVFQKFQTLDHGHYSEKHISCFYMRCLYTVDTVRWEFHQSFNPELFLVQGLRSALCASDFRVNNGENEKENRLTSFKKKKPEWW